MLHDRALIGFACKVKKHVKIVSYDLYESQNNLPSVEFIEQQMRVRSSLDKGTYLGLAT